MAYLEYRPSLMAKSILLFGLLAMGMAPASSGLDQFDFSYLGFRMEVTLGGTPSPTLTPNSLFLLNLPSPRIPGQET